MGEIVIDVCRRNILCVDCDDERCAFVGSYEAICPKWTCDHPGTECEECEFLKEFIKSWNKTV